MTEALGTHWGLGTGRAYAHRAPGTGGRGWWVSLGVVASGGGGGGTCWWLVVAGAGGG
jgi:hypothetical protein